MSTAFAAVLVAPAGLAEWTLVHDATADTDIQLQQLLFRA